MCAAIRHEGLRSEFIPHYREDTLQSYDSVSSAYRSLWLPLVEQSKYGLYVFI